MGLGYGWGWVKILDPDIRMDYAGAYSSGATSGTIKGLHGLQVWQLALCNSESFQSRNYREKWRTRFIKIRKPIRVIILSLTITAILAGAYGLYIMKKALRTGECLYGRLHQSLLRKNHCLVMERGL